MDQLDCENVPSERKKLLLKPFKGINEKAIWDRHAETGRDSLNCKVDLFKEAALKALPLVENHYEFAIVMRRIMSG